MLPSVSASQVPGWDTSFMNNSSFTRNLWYSAVFWYLVFEMGGITSDKANLISVVVESLLYGSLPKSSRFCSITNKLGSGIFTVMFGFTLWVIVYERSGRMNMKLLLPSLALYVLATAVSHLMESIPRITHLTLDYVKHLTTNAYRIVKSFITYRDAPGGPIAYLNNLSGVSFLLRSSFHVLQTLLGDFCLVRKYHCYHHSLLRCTWYHFADLPVLSRMATQYMDNKSTDPTLDILCR